MSLHDAGRPFGVALVGHGYSGRTLHVPLIEATPGLELLSVVSSGPGPFGQGGARRADLDSVLADPDVRLVVAATPTATHGAVAEQALLAGKHVVVDKPMCATAAEAARLAALAEARGLMLTVFHNRRWDSDFLTLKSLIADGKLGEVHHFESRWSRHRPMVRDRWRERAGPGAGVWFDLGSHLVDQALQLFGEPAWVLGDLASQRGGGAHDYMHVVLGYPSGLRAILHGGSLAPAPEPRFIVHGSAGSYLKEGLDLQEQALAAGKQPAGADWGVDPRPGRLVDAATGAGFEIPSRPGAWPAFYVQVRDAMMGGSPPVAASEAVRVIEVIERAIESAKAGRRWTGGAGASEKPHP